MTKQFFKTTERQRTSARDTRGRRAAAGKPQPNLVDEALSAALKSSLKRIRADGDKATRPSEVLDQIFDAAASHLVDVRGMDRKQSSVALSARLIKRRRYISAS
ncbi:hypothetical protein ELH69_37765 [Rhizobium ruizarguesonis]|nr:hypothetical protein ELH69_37765 [Rhizobium ruizarguesonis]